jgi:2-methyl-3-hydroxypyridine 5-carboxylic acid dioxygenase
MNAYTVAQAASESDIAGIPVALVEWERVERPITDRCQDRSQEYANTRGMAYGNQFTGDVNETTLYDPTNSHRHDAVV